jgi:hypothetical protein
MIVARYHIGQLLQAGAAGILIFPGDHAVERRQGRLVSTGLNARKPPRGHSPNPRDGLSLCVSAAVSGAPQYPFR